MSKQKIIIDTDPGIDDALAVLLALASTELDILGITTVIGNISLETAFNNTRRLCALAGRAEIPVFKGCGQPLKREWVSAEWVHGRDGLGGVVLPESKAEKKTQHAVDFLLTELDKHLPQTITLAALGPLTNIAEALQKAPEIMQKLKKIVIMGGSFDEKLNPRGNASPYAEYNIFADPHAADLVFNSGIDLTVIPMEVGKQAIADDNFTVKLKNLNKPSAMIVEMMTVFKNNINSLTVPLYDPCVIGYLLQSDLFKGRRGTVKTIIDDCDERLGMTVLQPDLKANLWIAEQIDHFRFLELVLEKMALF